MENHKNTGNSIENEAKELENSRNAYVDEYKRVMSIMKEQEGKISKLKKKIFGYKYKSDELPEHLLKLETTYNQSLRDKGNRMYSEKRNDLKQKQISEEEIKRQLEEYINKEIYDEIIVNEEKKLQEAKTETLPPKEKSMFKKGIDWYLKQSRTRRIIISSTISTLAFAAFMPGTIAAAGGIAAFAGTRLARATISTIVGQAASKMYDFLLKDKTKEKRMREESEFKKIFSANLKPDILKNDTNENKFTIENIKEAKEKHKDIKEKEQQRKRNRVIHKAIVTAIAGGITSFASGSVLGTGSNNHENIENFKKGNIEIQKEPINVLENSETNAGIKVETEFSSNGSIQTLNDLKQEILLKYEDISKAPKNVQEFLKTNSTQEAIKLGLFDPNNQEESAFITKGSSLEFDEKGNLILKDIKSGEINYLINENGDIEKYHGKMFDSDNQKIYEKITRSGNQKGELESFTIRENTNMATEGDLPYDGNSENAHLLREDDLPLQEEDKIYYKMRGPSEIEKPEDGIYYKIKNLNEIEKPKDEIYYSIKRNLEPEVIRYPGDSPNKVLQRIIENNPKLAEYLGWTKENTLKNFALSESSNSLALLKSPEIVSHLSSNEIIGIFKYDVEKNIWPSQKLSEETYMVLLDKHFGHYDFNNYVHGVNTEEWMDIRKIKAEKLFSGKIKNLEEKYSTFIEETKRLSRETGIVPKTGGKERLDEFYLRLIKYKLTH